MGGLRLLQEAQEAGLVVRAVGELLVIRGPRKQAILAKRLLARKAEIMELIRLPKLGGSLDPDDAYEWFADRAAIMVHDGGLPRERAEAAALANTIRRLEEAAVLQERETQYLLA
jgi:hypothetical protein